MVARRRIVLLVLGVTASSAGPPARAQPTYEHAECPFEPSPRLAGERVECGYLRVPERWDEPGGRTLRIAVAVIRSHSESPRPDPFVYLMGGPGQPALQSLPSRLPGPLLQSLLRERDVVQLDFRGTGYSDPAFCPELDAALRHVLYEGLSSAERQARQQAAMAACRSHMLADGVDLGAYTSAAAARDLAALRTALGYDEWNLYGPSYGSRLALIAMRDAPEGLRSVILASTIPPNAAEQPITNFQRALGLVFATCAADPACAADYPDLEQRFYDTLDRLAADPLVIAVDDTVAFPTGRMVLDGRSAALAVSQALYPSSVIPYVPLIIRMLERRDGAFFARLADRISDPGSVSRGLFLSVACYERAPYLSAATRRADAARAPRLAPHGELVRLYLESCDAWHEHRAPPAKLAPVHSTIPTLVFAGAFDPITPPEWGRLTAASLPNSHYVETRTGGHVSPVDGCIRRIMQEFLDDPARRPDTACNEARSPMQFVTGVRLTSGVYRLGTAFRGGMPIATVAWLGGTLLVLLSGLVVWPAVWATRRMRRLPAAENGPTILPIATAAAASAAALVFVGVLAWTIAATARTRPLTLAFGVPQPAASAFALPWVVLALGVVSLGLAASAWRHHRWGAVARTHYTLVAIATLSFVVFLGYWQLL
jgi:pimeloyl-ACP methyl ester carboxylesterase